jgi:large subunit ribosomal protein L9
MVNVTLLGFKGEKLKVLLIKDVKSLGKTGEIKEVKDGYGKNFLIGKGFAKHATDEVVAQWKENQDKIKAEEAKLKKESIEIVKKIEDHTITIKHKIGENGHLFGSVKKDDIADEVKKDLGIEIDKKSISIDKTIKTEGIYEVDIKLLFGIHAKLKLEIVGE